MAARRQLKVFRTPIGFHDAYVAAPSQKAALEAWGADSNLFAQGSAELVDDPELMREPLQTPGKVIRRLRGTLAEHVAALPKSESSGRAPGLAKSRPPIAPSKASRRPSKPPPKPKPAPKRTALDKAETELARIEARHEDALAELAQRQAQLDQERREVEARQRRERDRLAARADAAREKYERAMREWRAG